MTKNGSVPAADLVSKLKIASSDDSKFSSLCNQMKRITTATDHRAALSYNDMYEFYMQAAQDIVIASENNPNSKYNPQVLLLY